MRKLELTGIRFGWLLVESLSHCRRYSRWNCVCDCGNRVTVVGWYLTSGNTTSCGCKRTKTLLAISTTHGKSQNTPEYNIWASMKQRCLNPNNAAFKHYGGRGIKICKRWERFENFINDIGSRPSKAHSLERVNNDRGYFKGNCKWETWKEQCANRRSSRFISHSGKTMTCAQWERELGFARGIIAGRLYLGWTTERALTQKPQKIIQ